MTTKLQRLEELLATLQGGRMDAESLREHFFTGVDGQKVYLSDPQVIDKLTARIAAEKATPK